MGLILRDNEYKKVIAKLVKRRLELGYKQTDVAKAMKANQSEISRIETCETQLDILELKALCKLYKITLESVLEV